MKYQLPFPTTRPSYFIILAGVTEQDAIIGASNKTFNKNNNHKMKPQSPFHRPLATISSSVKRRLLLKLHKKYISSLILSLTDNGLNGDLLSEEEEEERSRSDLEDGEDDSMDSDKGLGGGGGGGPLNLVTSAPHSRSRSHHRGSSVNHNNNNHTRERERHLNNNNNHHIHGHGGNLKNGGGGGLTNGHGGQHSPPSPMTPSPAGIQAALAALQAGQLSLNQVCAKSKANLHDSNQMARYRQSMSID